jgi:hypothetical protein
MRNLKDHPVGTRIQIGERTFERINVGSFWREENENPSNRVARPSCTVEGIAKDSGCKPVVLPPKT